MEKEDVGLIAQLLTGIKDALNSLEEAQKNNDLEKLNSAKKEILNFQKEIDKLI
ncbi:MAG: hypothetical protein AABW65_03100 [Nanoarchaeota archaeon]